VGQHGDEADDGRDFRREDHEQAYGQRFTTSHPSRGNKDEDVAVAQAVGA
jgi:hypothetical protein